MSNSDRIIRVVVVAFIFLVLWLQNIVTGIAGIILLVLGGILVLTSIFGFCPFYKLFGINTRPVKKAV